ncbi:MAG: hypothetical protein R6U62_10040 [Bacteroidales bacterium]
MSARAGSVDAAFSGSGTTATAWVGLLGTVFGILFFALNVNFFKTHFTAESMSGDISEALGIHQWIIVPVAAIIFIAIIYIVNKKVDDFKQNF